MVILRVFASVFGHFLCFCRHFESCCNSLVYKFGHFKSPCLYFVSLCGGFKVFVVILCLFLGHFETVFR